ncbi:MAG: universal stress protein [Candidatus Thermoplasmatota archaeon]|nr:universal stress protein [Candidatus Thermoplasmatota archaeon]MCL5665272.1 universal stress protein [Candidatus Thermoplasmatota archaeon]
MKALVAFDGTEGSKKALSFAMKLDSVLDELIITYVYPNVVAATAPAEAYVPPAMLREQDRLGDSIIETARQFVEHSTIQSSFVKLDAGGDQVARVIINAAKERGAHMIITGTRKLGGLSKILLGSVSSEILKQTTIPVIVVPPDYEG